GGGEAVAVGHGEDRPRLGPRQDRPQAPLLRSADEDDVAAVELREVADVADRHRPVLDLPRGDLLQVAVERVVPDYADREGVRLRALRPFDEGGEAGEELRL